MTHDSKFAFNILISITIWNLQKEEWKYIVCVYMCASAGACCLPKCVYAWILQHETTSAGKKVPEVCVFFFSLPPRSSSIAPAWVPYPRAQFSLRSSHRVCQCGHWSRPCRQDGQPLNVFSCIFPDDTMASANIPSLINITKRSWWATRIQLSEVVPKCVYTQFLCRQMSLWSPSGRQGDLPSKTTSPDFGVFNLKLYETIFN